MQQYRERCAQASGWVTSGDGWCNAYVNTASATTGSIVLNSNAWTAGTVSTAVNWIVRGNDWVAGAAPQRPRKWLEGQAKNHRGVFIRSHHLDRQFDGASHAEMLAMQLLRKMVGQDEFRRYLRHGHVHARAESGLVYQIGRLRTIQVWDRGVKIASLCVHLKREHNTPPTDEVVGKLLIVECDEPDIWQRSNVTWLTQQRHPIAAGKCSAGFIGAGAGQIYIGNQQQAAAVAL